MSGDWAAIAFAYSSETWFTVASSGLVTLNGLANPFAVGAIVTVSNALTEDGLRRGGDYLISAIGPLGNQFTLQGWLWGDCTGGQVYQQGNGFFAVTADATKAVRSTTHKIGRPFAGYRGRRSRARRR